MSQAIAANEIEGFVAFLDSPSWEPTSIPGHAKSNDVSVFKRCIPLIFRHAGYGDDAEFFQDGTPDVNGGRPVAMVRIEGDLPEYHSIRRVHRLPPNVRPLAGQWFRMSEGVNARKYGVAKDSRLVVINNYMRFKDGQFSVLPQADAPISYDPNSLEWEPGFLFAFSLAYRYFASMEVGAGNGTSVSIPLSLPQLREVLKDRDKPESGGRRPSLIHLVRQHQRKMEDGDEIRIREHLRGKIECHWRGWDIVLRPSDYDSDRLGGN